MVKHHSPLGFLLLDTGASLTIESLNISVNNLNKGTKMIIVLVEYEK